MSDGTGPVPFFAARVAVQQQQRSYAPSSFTTSADQFNGRAGGMVTYNPAPDYCVAVSSLVPITSRRCPSPLTDGVVQRGGANNATGSSQPPPSYGCHQSRIATTWSYPSPSPPTTVSSSTTTSPTSVDAALGVVDANGTAAAGGTDGALRVKLLQLRLLQQQQQQHHLATRRGRTATADSDDDGNRGYQTSAALGRQPWRRADVEGQRARSQSAVGRRPIVVDSIVASRPSSTTQSAPFVSTPAAVPSRKAGIATGAAAVETSFPNRRLLNFAPAEVGGLRSAQDAAPDLGECRAVHASTANDVPRGPRPASPHQRAQHVTPLRRASDERNAWLNHYHQQQSQQPYSNSPDWCPLTTGISSTCCASAPSVSIDDVLYREAAEYVIAARPTIAYSTGVAPWEVDEFLRSTNLNFVPIGGGRCDLSSSLAAGLASTVFQKGVDNDETPPRSRRRRSDQWQPTMDSGLQRVDRRAPFTSAASSSSSSAAAAVKRSVTLHQRPLVEQAARPIADRGGGRGGAVTVSGALIPPHRWSADGDLEPHACSSGALNMSASGYEKSQRQCRQQQDRDLIVSNQPVAVGLWIGTATKTEVRRRVVATPTGSTSSGVGK